MIKGLANNSEGEIYTIMPVKKNVYIYANLITPGDFIISEKAYPENLEEILEIENNSLLDNILNYDLKNFETPKDCKIVDTGSNETAFVLLSNNPQIVLSKITTANHIKRLVEIESKYY